MKQQGVDPSYDRLTRAVSCFGRFRRRWAILDGLGRFILIGPGALLAWFLADWLIGLPAWPLLIALGLAVGLGVWAGAWFLVPRLFRRIRVEREALAAESLHGGLDNQLIGALQLGREIAEARQPLGYSPNLVRALVARTAELVAPPRSHAPRGNALAATLCVAARIRRRASKTPRSHAERGNEKHPEGAARGTPLDLCRLVDLTRARRRLAGAGALAMAIACCLVLAQGAVATRIERLRDAYATVLDALFPVEMRVAPGDIAVVRGSPVTLRIEVLGARRRQATLFIEGLVGRESVERESVQRESVERKASSVEREAQETGDAPRSTLHAPRFHTLQLAQGKASFEVASADESFCYAFAYGRRRTPEHRVLVGDRPQISAMHYEIAYPAYTGQPPRTLVGRVPRIQGLVGTSVLVSFAATTELHPDYCAVEWQDGAKQALATTGRFGHFSFTIDRPERATLHLTGAYGPGFEMAHPVSFEVAVQRDEPPSVQVLLRQKKLTMLAEEATAFGLRWVAEDDFGVAEVALDYRVDTVDKLLGRPTREGAVPRRVDPPLERVRGEFLDVFKALSPPLQPGDRITMTVVARDNNTETGPSAGRSQPIEIVVVRQDLSGFVEKQFDFGSHTLLGGLSRIRRETDLLVDPVKTVRTEAKQEIDRQTLRSRVAQEAWPSGSEDAIGDYFRLLSGSD